VILCSHPQLVVFLLLVSMLLLPSHSLDPSRSAAPIFRRTLSGYETWFVESPRQDLAVSGLAHPGPVVLLERATGLVLRELSPNASAFGAAFSDDQALVCIAERYALRVYEPATGRLLSMKVIEMDGPDIAASGRALFLRGRQNGAEGLFRLDLRGSGLTEDGPLARVAALPPGIVLGGNKAASQTTDPLPAELRETFFRALPPRVMRRSSAAVLAKGAVVQLDLRSGRPRRILDLDGADPQIFETDRFERIGVACAPKGADHYVYLWRLDPAAEAAVQRPERSYQIPLHPVRLVPSDSAAEVWISGFRGGRDIGGGRIIETVDAAGMLDLETGVWKESTKDEAPSWAEAKSSNGIAEAPHPGRLFYRMLDHGVIAAGSPKTGEPVVYLSADGRGEWAAFTPDGRWDGSPGALGSLLLMSDGLRTWTPDPERDPGFTPGLVEALVADFEKVRLSIVMDRGESARYRVGEEATVLVSVDKPVWLRLYHVEEGGKTRLIWPNDYELRQWIDPGADLPFPPTGAKYSFQVTSPGGLETIIAFASTRHFIPDDPNLPSTGDPDPGSQVKRGYEKPEYYPRASASARTRYTVTE
jgi:hypothetical protein